MTQSILELKEVQRILDIAKQNLEHDGKLLPVLFLHFDSDERVVVPLHLPDTAEGRRQYMTSLGFSVLKEGKNIEEAVMVLESWYVEAIGNEDILKLAPSRHPRRKEAIIVIGRDASKSRSLMVIQPFTRTGEDRPLWGEISRFSSDDPSRGAQRYEGILDYLFVRERSKATA